MSFDFLMETGRQARNAAPIALATVGDTTGYITLDGITKIVLLAYGVLQVGYLIWKWHREYKNGKSNK